MTNEQLIEALRSQIGDDVSRVFDHEALFKLSSERIKSLAEELIAAREVAIDTTAHLAACLSLLLSGGRKAAPSDKMFKMMVADYEASLVRARAALARSERGE